MPSPVGNRKSLYMARTRPQPAAFPRLSAPSESLMSNTRRAGAAAEPCLSYMIGRALPLALETFDGQSNVALTRAADTVSGIKKHCTKTVANNTVCT